MSAKVDQGTSKSPVGEVKGLDGLKIPGAPPLTDPYEQQRGGRGRAPESPAVRKARGQQEKESAEKAAAEEREKKTREAEAQKKAEAEEAAKQVELNKPIPFNSTVVPAVLQSPFKDHAPTLKQLPELTPTNLTSTSDAEVLRSGSEFYIKTKGKHWTNVNDPKDTRLLSSNGKELQRVEVAPVTADEKTTYYYRPEGSKSKLIFTAEQLNVEPSKRTAAILGVGDKFVDVKLATDTGTNQTLIKKPGEEFYSNEGGDVYRDVGQGKFEKLTPTKLDKAANEIAAAAQKKIGDAEKTTKLNNEQKKTEIAKWEPYAKPEAVPTVYIVQNGENREVYSPKGDLLVTITKENKFLEPNSDKEKRELSVKVATESGVPYEVKLSFDKSGLQARLKTDATNLVEQLKEGVTSGSTSQRLSGLVSVGFSVFRGGGELESKPQTIP